VSLEMHFEAVIERGWRFNWRPRLSELRDELGGYDRARLEENLEAVDLEGGATAAETLAGSGKLAGSGILWILG